MSNFSLRRVDRLSPKCVQFFPSYMYTEDLTMFDMENRNIKHGDHSAVRTPRINGLNRSQTDKAQEEIRVFLEVIFTPPAYTWVGLQVLSTGTGRRPCTWVLRFADLSMGQ